MSSRFATRHRTRALPALLLLSLLSWLLAAGGCSSESPNPVGAGDGETAIDTALTALSIVQMEEFGVLAVSDPDAPLDENEVLYFGRSDTEESSILVNYDFSVLDHPDSAYLLPYLTADNIRFVDIKLVMLEWYGPWRGGVAPDDEDTTYVPPDVKLWPGADKFYDVHQLMAPFDTLAYPGPEPAFEAGSISQLDNEAQPGPIVNISCVTAPVIQWIGNREQVGIIIREGNGSDPGVLGLASRDMRHGGSTLPLQDAAVTLGAALIVGLNQVPDSWDAGRQDMVFAPVADVSTWHVLEDPSTDPTQAITVRTHLRSYPVVRFDLSALPQDIRVNRANLVVVNDTSRSEGHRTVLTCSEVPEGFAPPGETTILLDDIEPEIYFLFGSGSWEPEHLYEHELRFNVTSSLQRYVNEAYEGERAFLLAAGEYFFPGYNSDPDPDFWFTKWVFFGASADSALRPRLEVSYTRLDELSGEGQP